VRNIPMKRALYISTLALMALVLCRPASAQINIGIGTGGVGISVGFAPPAIPEYEQPPCPEDGYIWVPGYWAWDDDDADYYWVPGTWVTPPQQGLLYTPAYWGWENGAYIFHDGYWANEVGFYGGVNYGYGYYGDGFAGGRWNNGRFMYNTAVVRVNETVIRNVYVDKTVVVNTTNVTRVSYNGGQGGTTARPTPQQQQVAQARHIPPAQAQMQNRQAARSNPQLRASSNQGKPPVAATAKPGDFTAHAVAAKSAGATWHPPADRRAAAKPNPNAAGNQNARQGQQNARPGENNQPGEPARPQQQNNNRPGEIARPQQQQNNHPPDVAHPQQTPRPGENARPQPNTQPGATGHPAEPPRPQPNAHPNESPRPGENPRPQARPDANSNPRTENRAQPNRPEQQHPAEKPDANQQKDREPQPKPKEQEHPPQQ
jgi:hypothetical protein